MKIQQLMHTDVKCCRPEDSLATAAQLMWDFDVGALPVVDREAHTIGMITDRDICMAAYTQGLPISNIAVASAMAKQIVSCSPEDDVDVAEMAMADNQVHRLPVLDVDRHLLGIITLNDLAREAEKRGDEDLTAELVADALAAIASPRASVSP